MRNQGCLPFSQKIRKFRFEVKWKGNFPENLFGNCGQPPEVVLFFRSERNSRNALTICENLPFPGPFSQDRVNIRDGMAVSKSGTEMWGLGGVGTWGRGGSGTWGRGDAGTQGLGDVGTSGLGDAVTHSRSTEFQKWENIPEKVEVLMLFSKMINCMLFKCLLKTQRNSKIGFSKIHSRHPSQSSTVKQSRSPNVPLLILKLKFHVAAFVVVVVVAKKPDPYDFFSVTEV